MRLTFVLVLVVLDLWSKSAVFAWLDVHPRPAGMVFLADTGHWRYPVAGEWLAFMPSRNRGAAFGQLQSWPWLLVSGRVLAGIVLTVLVWRARSEHRLVLWALVLVLAGALGNLYDNLFQPRPDDHPFGEVRDFIDVYFSVWTWHFPTFNVADSCISVGAVLLLLTSFQRPEDEAGEAAPEEGPETGSETGTEASDAAGTGAGTSGESGRASAGAS